MAGLAVAGLATTACGSAPTTGAAPSAGQSTIVSDLSIAGQAAPATPGAQSAAPAAASATSIAQAAAALRANPIAVTLNRALAQPQPGDSKNTLKARAALAAAQAQYDSANQQYDLAAEQLRTVTAQLVTAHQAATKARAAADAADAILIAHVQNQYMSGDPVPVAAQALFTADGSQVLDNIELGEQISQVQADLVQNAQTAEQAAKAAQNTVKAEDQQAAAARGVAVSAQNRAAKALSAASSTVGKLHDADLIAFARAASHGADDMVGAATAIRAQAIASGAATEKTIPSGLPPVQTIALAVRALLNQATGRSAKPTAASFRPTTGTPVDETAVMGGSPNLGKTAKYTGTEGTGTSKALTGFRGFVSHTNWPNAGVGTAVPGTAPFQKANGVTVHPMLPAYPAGYQPLRAEVAVDQALAQLGSPYVWDAAGPTTFDCSGLMLWAWGHAGVALDHYTGDQVHEGVKVTPAQLLPGDLVLFGSALHHVGMYLGAGYMIDAPDTGEYVKIQKVSDDGDFAVAVRP